jgi:glycosyltransferase involved in cell wall biosynthesis
MKISLSIPEEFTVTNHGYGVISQQIVMSLQRLGYHVPFRDASAPVELCIGQPYLWQWSSPDSYKIGLVAWESTKIPDKWWPGLKAADEVWTPSPIVAGWFAEQGLQAKVYQHGIDMNEWTKKRRRRERVEGSSAVRFLHIGEPAPRKGGALVYHAFRDLFGNENNRARLTIKAHGYSTIRGRQNARPESELSNLRMIKEEYTPEQMVDLVKRHDVLIYPSYGEGFGLIPLQAMATGMPVICTEAWAPYKHLIIPELRVTSVLGESPWQNMHPGQVFFPGMNSLKDAMLFAANNLDTLAARAFGNTQLIAQQYDWDKLTAEAFAPVVSKFDS